MLFLLVLTINTRAYVHIYIYIRMNVILHCKKIKTRQKRKMNSNCMMNSQWQTFHSIRSKIKKNWKNETIRGPIRMCDCCFNRFKNLNGMDWNDENWEKTNGPGMKYVHCAAYRPLWNVSDDLKIWIFRYRVFMHILHTINRNSLLALFYDFAR